MVLMTSNPTSTPTPTPNPTPTPTPTPTPNPTLPPTQVLMTFLWAGCLQAWKTARINYLYMFDLDQVLGVPRSNLLTLTLALNPNS